MATQSEIQKLRSLLGGVGVGIISSDTIETAYEIAERFVHNNATITNIETKRDATIMLSRVMLYESYIEVVHREIGRYPEGSRNTLREIKASAEVFLRAAGITNAFEQMKRHLPPLISMSKSAANYNARYGADII